MDKTILKTFAVNSRNKLIEDTIYRLSLLGITEDEIQDPIEANGMQTFQIGGTNFSIYDDDINKRKEIIEDIESKGFNNFVEEVAYTWFNRIIAIRYMEVNNYLPTKTRVLSSETEGKIEPDILTDALDIDLDYTQEEKELIFKLKDENKLDELFRFLFIKQSNKLNEILPGLFKTTDDSLELLLNISFTSEEDVVRQLIDTIPEEDFTKQVEIIGWLYQYYISEKKNQVININKSNIKKEDIPAATQLFTTDWVVKYMVDNSLGRYWIERNPNSSLKEHLEYYLGEAQQDEETQSKLDEIRSENISVEELTFFDPCMGSGHILVYAFDLFFEIYKELGYLERDIPELILKNNIFGLDIDDRAYQLAYFAVLMKARKYDRKILQKGIVPNVYAIQESGNITDSIIEFIQKHDEKIVNDVIYLKEIFESGKEFGSLIQVKNIDFNNLRTSLNEIIDKSKSTLTDINITNIISNDLMALINQAELLSKKYSAVVTNPPYMNKFEKNLKDFAKKNYKDYSKDLFSMFIYRNFDFCKKYGYNALMTPFVWMFIKNYENLRKFIINNKSISSLIQLEYSAFSEATVPICTFVLSNFDENYAGTYLKLSEFTGGMDVQKEKVLQIIKGDEILNDKNKYIIKQFNFDKIPGSPIAYWIDDNLIACFNNTKLESLANVKQGLATADNNRFLRYWWEVDFNNIGFSSINCEDSKNTNKKWFPYNKGGDYRKWWGNQEFVVNWENDGYEIRNIIGPNGRVRSRAQNTQFYFHKSLSWSKISSGKVAFRYYPNGFIFDVAGCSVFLDKKNINYIFGFLNSNICGDILDLISPTLNYEVGHVASLPIIFDESKQNEIENLVITNINIEKEDWDENETSWNFKSHPFVFFKGDSLSEKYNFWQKYKTNQFNYLKTNEEKLNKLFYDIYNVDGDHEIEDKYISLNKNDLKKDIESIISYSVGCMFGRYNLNQGGLCFAGGEFDLNKYHNFIPDDDNIIPVLDTAYFDDDIVGYFTKFIEKCFGKEKLEENLDFIAKVLSNSSKPSREVLRDYFLKNFFNSHKKIYKKHPIYWQFSSGKENGFNCLIYMHRYEPSLVAKIRTDYLHKTQKAIEQRIANTNTIINNSTSKQEVANITKEKVKLQKQLKETQEYDELLAHIANQNIEIDLDNGVKFNYELFQNIEIKKEGKKSKKLNLLKKI
jgi:type II restriction/modification system DNA methylase subunit YeeA